MSRLMGFGQAHKARRERSGSEFWTLQFVARHTPEPSLHAVPSTPPGARYSRQICPAAFVKGGRLV